jgi:hypothetical protein
MNTSEAVNLRDNFIYMNSSWGYQYRLQHYYYFLDGFKELIGLNIPGADTTRLVDVFERFERPEIVNEYMPKVTAWKHVWKGNSADIKSRLPSGFRDA